MIKTTIFLIMISLCLMACQRVESLTDQEQEVVNHLTSRMQTHCVGRYVIDLPREVTFGAGVTINDVEISSVQEKDLRSFKAMLVRREFKLRETKSMDKYPFLYREGHGASENTRYFVSRGYTDNDPNFRKIEAYKWDKGYTIKLEIEANDYTSPNRTSDPLVQKMGFVNDTPMKLDRILNYLNRIRGRSEDDIPAEPGVCFVGGFITGKAAETGGTEDVRTTFSILHNPDVMFKIYTFTDIQEDTTLMQRSRMPSVYLNHFNVKTLRSGMVALPNLPAEEWLTSRKTIQGVPGHYFTLEANAQTGSPDNPFVMLDLNTGLWDSGISGRPETASLSDGEAIGLWDAVSRTLRPRPNGF